MRLTSQSKDYVYVKLLALMKHWKNNETPKEVKFKLKNNVEKRSSREQKRKPNEYMDLTLR